MLLQHARPDLAYGQGPIGPSQPLFHLCSRLWHTMGHVESDDPRQQDSMRNEIAGMFKNGLFFFLVDFDTVVHDFCFAVVDDC